MGSNKKRTLDDEQLVKEVVNYYNNSYYNTSELAEMLNVKKQKITDIVSDKEQKLLLEYCNKEELMKFEYMKKNRKKLSSLRSKNSGSYLIKSVEHRYIVKEDAYFVKTKSGLELLNKVILFFQYEGNIVKMAKETQLSQNGIQLSLSSPDLKNILKEDIYEKLEVLLNYDKILTQNMLYEKKKLAEIMITDMERLLLNKDEPWQPTLPIDIIYRLLTEDPYVKMQYASCREEYLKVLEDYVYACNSKKEFSQQLIRK